MTLTEEQREAIRVISKLPMAIGCQLCHPYIMENYGSHFIVLRDMIDSSGTVEPTGGFDLEAARASISHYRIENTSNVDTESAIKELVDQANLAEEYLAEIERLRGYEIAARDLSADLTKVAGARDEQAARIEELEADLAQSEICIRARLDVIDQQAARIKELEDARKRSGAKYAKIINELRSSVYANIPGLDVGKIGPDAETGNRDHVVGPDQMVPNGKVWQITEERKAAINRGLQFLEWSYAKNSAHDTKEQIAVLWAMLDEASQ